MVADANLKVVRTQPTLRELALAKIRGAILSCRFKPGHRLIERELCEQLGVSRSIVREAMRHLEAEGIVETIPLKGPTVARLRPEHVAEIYQIRAMLEGDAARKCARNSTPELVRGLEQALRDIAAAYSAKDPSAVLAATGEFYRLLFLGGQKEVAWQIVRSLNARINQLRAMTISTPNRSKDGPAEMKRIVEAIRKKDPDAAQKACVAHVERDAALAQVFLAPVADDAEART
ncbi:MAG: GntR family transcriptional regulator [Hyphomicrobiaceae bacterium]